MLRTASSWRAAGLRIGDHRRTRDGGMPEAQGWRPKNGVSASLHHQDLATASSARDKE